MNRELRNRIIEFLLPHMEPESRKSLINGALYGCDVLSDIHYWERGSRAFTDALVTTLESHGVCFDDEPSLVTLLRYVGQQRGTDVAEQAEMLIEKIHSSDIGDPLDPEEPVLPEPSPNPRMRDHIFISYSHDDKAFIDRLADDLRRRGYIVWIDFAGIRGGDVWRQSIVDGIHASALVLVVITPTALQSEWVELEVKTAQQFDKPIIPVLLETLTDAQKRIYDRLGLEKIQYRDFTVGYDDALPELLTDLPQPQAGLPGYCQKLIARLADAPWGLDHYIQERAKILPIHASPYDEGIQSGTSENLLHRLWHNKRTIVLGEPGTGKSVAVERLAWELASNEQPIVPVIINLREYDGMPLLNWVRLKLLESDEEPLRKSLQSTDDTEKFLHEVPFTFYLLLDGLNEVRPAYRETVVQEIRRLSLQYPAHAMVVTSRVQDESWRDLRGGSYQADTVVVQAITESQAQDYLSAHLGDNEARDLWRRLDERMRGLAETPLLLWLIKEAWLESRGDVPGNRGELYANFIERMLRRDDDRRLIEIPRQQRLEALKDLALAMHEEQIVALPRAQIKKIVSEETLDALLVNGLLRGESIIRFAPHQTVQEHFAARAIQSKTEKEIDKKWWQNLVKFDRDFIDYAADPWWTETFIQLAGMTENPNLLAQKIAEENPWLAWWCVREGRAVDPETEQIIAAQSARLVDSESVQDRRNAVQALLKLPRARVIDQLAKLAVDTDVSVAEPATKALLDLGEHGYEAIENAAIPLVDSESRQDRHHVVQVLLKLPRSRVIDQLAKLAVDTYASVAEPARQALDDIGEAGKLAAATIFEERIIRYEPSERAELGRWLSEWGDLRPGIGTIERNGIVLPDIEWVTIPAGEFTYQDTTMTLDYDFKMARYPVTYAQFQTFIDDPDGFHDPRWWEGLALPDDHNNAPGDQAFKYWNHPRENVSWYDAVAFCRWLSWCMVGGYDLNNIAAWAVRLPTEYEWEKAARANTGWMYPYGDEFDTNKGNTKETGLGQTSAVGIFPHGDTPHWEKPISDLSGNVFEWCLTDYKKSQPDATIENMRSTTARRVLRGGSLDGYHNFAHAAVRYGDFSPSYRSKDCGLRVVCSRL